MKKILVIGSINIDYVIETGRLVKKDETLRGGKLTLNAGGKGANQAVAAARLGADVTFIGAIGDDDQQSFLKKSLSDAGIDTDTLVVKENTKSGMAFIQVFSGNNAIVLSPGANDALSIDDIRIDFNAYDVLLLQNEIPMHTNAALIEKAHVAGLCIIYDPAPARQLDLSLMQKITIMTPNEKEAESIAGMKINTRSDAEHALLWMRKQGINHPVITRGDKGLLYYDETIRHLKALSVTPRDTTAAGDAFNGALAYMLAGRADLETSIDFARRAAAHCVGKKGAQKSMPALKTMKENLL